MPESVESLLAFLGASNVYEAGVKLIFHLGLPFDYDYVVVWAFGKNVEPLARAVALVERYNEFDGREASKALLELYEKGLIMWLYFGREGSPVIYVEPPYWAGQGKKYTEEERVRMLRRIRNRLAKLRPDELGYVVRIGSLSYYEEPSPETKAVRAWWD
jgi:hypothetical protein